MKGLLLVVACTLTLGSCMVNKLVDLSHFNAPNFGLMKKDGILGVIHKATQGIGYTDPTYQNRRVLAESEGLLWGAYHFGSNSVSGTVQADYFLQVVGDYSNVLLALDAEPNGKFTITKEIAEEFVSRVLEVTGRYPLLYGSPSFLSTLLSNSPLLQRCGLWVAHYTANSSPKLPTGKQTWVLWQYTNGAIGGTPREVQGLGACDRDRYAGTHQQLLLSWPNL